MRDPLASLTHFAAMLAALVFLSVLLGRARNYRLVRLPFFAFGAGMFLCYGASAIYHGVMLPEPELNVFRMIDQSAIYLLIAGSYTPLIHFLMPKGRFRSWLLVSVWTCAVVGIAAKWSISGMPYWAVVTPYIALGWLGLIPIRVLVRAIGGRYMLWIAAGGLLYTIGALIDLFGTQRLPTEILGAHEIFHVLTVGGTMCHATFVLRYLFPHARKQAGHSPQSSEQRLEQAM